MELDPNKMTVVWGVLLLMWVQSSVGKPKDASPVLQPRALETSDKIHFPEEDDSDLCHMNGDVTRPGTCTSFMECPAALDEWKKLRKQPQRCYFEGFTEFVCCEHFKTSPLIAKTRQTTTRRSAIGCRDPGPQTTTTTTTTTTTESPADFMPTVKGIPFAIGVPALPFEFPYMAALGWQSPHVESTTYSCGGVLVADSFVLTAAHCLNLNGEKPNVVRLGDTSLDIPDTFYIFNIKRAIPHPEYVDSLAYHDIAIIELTASTFRFEPACIWLETSFPTRNVTAIGYGHTKFGGPSSNVLIKADIFLNTNAECSQFYPPSEDLPRGLLDSQICAGNPEQRYDTCQGDSGGPMVIRIQREYILKTFSYVVGLTSLGPACGGTTPSIYTSVADYIDWIEDIIYPAE